MPAATICTNPEQWTEILYCINPYAWGNIGIALGLGFSIIGAAWYLFTFYKQYLF